MEELLEQERELELQIDTYKTQVIVRIRLSRAPVYPIDR